MGTAGSLGVIWWQIMTRRQGHRETVTIWTQEVLQSECIVQLYTLCKKLKRNLRTSQWTIRLPLRIVVCLFKRNMWKLSQRPWQTLLKQHRQFENTEFAHQTDAAAEHENYPCSFLKSSEHVRHFNQKCYIDAAKVFRHQSWVLGYGRDWRSKALIWFFTSSVFWQRCFATFPW